MPKLICATPLLELAIDNLHHLVRDEAYRVSKVIDNEFHYEPFEGTEEYCQEMADDLTTKGEIYLDDQIGVFKEHIYRGPIIYTSLKTISVKIYKRFGTYQEWNLVIIIRIEIIFVTLFRS